MLNLDRPVRVGIVGSGNFGTAVARKVALNALSDSQIDRSIVMWVYEEVIHGRNLTDIINEDHENVKYLPHIELPKNILASSDLVGMCENSDVLIFVVPHQFLLGVLHQIKHVVKPETVCVSLIKGIDFDKHGPKLLSTVIKEELHVRHVAVLMGANVATDVAHDAIVESTLACNDLSIAKALVPLLHSNTFRVHVSDDVSTVELCGALKNVVAVGAGFCDGLKLGPSSKAALLRQGISEMGLFCKIFDRDRKYKLETILQSCGVADVIATCYGGRNRKCAELFVERLEHVHATTHGHNPWEPMDSAVLKKLWHVIEAEVLLGQKLQGVPTCEEVIHCLKVVQVERSDLLEDRPYPAVFPLFHRIYQIALQGVKFDVLFDWETDDLLSAGK